MASGGVEDVYFNEAQVEGAIGNRWNEMMFPECKLIEEGGHVIDNRIDGIREAILKKDGIVGPEVTDQFRFFIGNAMNQNML